jgi:hypothetical protein
MRVLTVHDDRTVEEFDIEDEFFSLSPFPYMELPSPRLTATRPPWQL